MPKRGGAMSTCARYRPSPLAQHHTLLRCPLCAQELKLVEGQSLVCANRHCFDLAKHGYVNLLTHPVKTKYAKEMFTSRQALSQSGFFEPLDRRLAQIIVQSVCNAQPRHSQHNFSHRTFKVLDAGCGEGSHLARIEYWVNQDDDFAAWEMVGVGVDIAKEGIILAAKKYPHLMCCVADLGTCPFKSHQFDIILNILSPSNYAEFKRLLTGDGLVVKVVPEADYLRELRTFFYENTDKEKYDNRQTLSLFRKHLELLDHQRVRYSVTIENPFIDHLVKMTPLSWTASPQAMAEISSMNSMEITVDFSILIGKYPLKPEDS